MNVSRVNPENSNFVKILEMIVYKFGGASVKDAEGIRNLAERVKGVDDELVVVVSAFGKTTNALEGVVSASLEGKETEGLIDEIKSYHKEITDNLFPDNDKVRSFLEESFSDMKKFLENCKDTDYDFVYDQVVSLGEIWSTKIVEEWLKLSGVDWRWIDIRKHLMTDERYRDASILWPESSIRLQSALNFNEARKYIVQGFIGGTLSGNSTTLGREGSDYTAAIIANIMDAESVVVWKDVDGVLNADPKWMSDTSSLQNISYKEAVEMSFSGAKVIHPKTIKPLHNKDIPLYVKSFLNPGHPGTLISTNENRIDNIPVYVKKENQVLISLIPRDFSFVMGDHLGKIFGYFDRYGIKANLVQASAVSLAVCVDNDRGRIKEVSRELGKEFKLLYNDNVELYTIRQYNSDSINKVSNGRCILVEQKTRRTLRLVVGS